MHQSRGALPSDAGNCRAIDKRYKFNNLFEKLGIPPPSTTLVLVLFKAQIRLASLLPDETTIVNGQTALNSL